MLPAAHPVRAYVSTIAGPSTCWLRWDALFPLLPTRHNPVELLHQMDSEKSEDGACGSW